MPDTSPPASGFTPWLEPRPDSDYPLALTVGTLNFGMRTPAAEAERIVHRALDLGVRFFDTANFHGDGESERLLGNALRGRRDRAGIALWLGPNPSRTQLAWNWVPGAAVLRAVDEALERLGTDYVDLLYLDLEPGHEHGLESLHTVGRLMEQGKVGHWGLTGRDAGRLPDVNHQCDMSGLARPRVLRAPHNLLREGPIGLPRDLRVHVAVHGVLAGGVLAGHHRPGPVPPGSRFDRRPEDRRRYFFRCALGFAGELAALARERGLSPAALAYAWLSEEYRVDSLVLGPATTAHLEEAVDVLWKRWSPDSEELDETLERLEALREDWFGEPG